MNKAIVTGANGFVGSYLVKELIKNNVDVISIVRNKNSNLDLLPKSENYRVIFCELSDIENLEFLIPDRDIDAFYHFAWQGSAGEDRVKLELQTQNSIWSVDCVKIAQKIGCKRFIGAGSIMEREALSAVYSNGNKPGLGYIYGTGKVTAHCLSKTVAASIGIDHIWALITNAYGPCELSPRFINTTIRKIINNQHLQFTAATQNYDFVYITDVAKAFYHIGLLGKPFSNYTIGSSTAKPLKEFILELREELAPAASLNFGDIPFTGVNLPIEDFSITDLVKDTEFEPEVSFREGVRHTMAWLNHMEG